MAGGPEDHFTDSRELYVLVEGDEWAHMEALDPDAGYWARRFAQLVNWRARGEKAVIEPRPCSGGTRQAAQGNRAAEDGGRADQERVRGSQGETALGRSLGVRSCPTPAMDDQRAWLPQVGSPVQCASSDSRVSRAYSRAHFVGNSTLLRALRQAMSISSSHAIHELAHSAGGVEGVAGSNPVAPI